MFPVESPKMMNYRLKKTNPPAPLHDRSFYDRFNRAWTNLRENEVELRVRLLTAESKGKSAKLRIADVRL
jgi:hypothetical protein